MKGLKEFLILLSEDKDLFEEVEKVQHDSVKVVEIAKKHGYEFTEDEFEDAKMEVVTGGVVLDKAGELLGGLIRKAAGSAAGVVKKVIS